PTFTGATDPYAWVQLYLDGSPAASGNVAASASSTGAWSLTPLIGLDNTYTAAIGVTDLAGNVSPPSPGLTFTRDTVGPLFVTPMAFQFNTAPQQMTMTFSDDVATTLTSSDLTVLDLATSGTVGATLAYDQPAHAATFTLSAPAPGVLP